MVTNYTTITADALWASLTITAEEAAAAKTGAEREALLDRKLANLRYTVIDKAAEMWGWEYRMNTTGMK